MRQKLRQEAGRPSADQHVQGGEPRERRGDLLGAESGPGPGRSWLAAVQRVQVRARRPGQPRNAGRHGGVPLGGHAGPLHRAVGADGAHLLRPAGGRGHNHAMRPGHRRGPDQARRPPHARLGLEPEPGLPRPGRRHLAALAHQLPGLGGRFAAAAQPGADSQTDEVQSPPPVATGRDGCLPMFTSGWLGSSACHGEWSADPDRARRADTCV